jgi:uncharacterized protein (DUF1778 family)
MTATSNKTDRVDLRLEPEVKQVWERGAELVGVSLAAFIKMATTERATELINTYDILTLSPEESAWFVDLLQQPAVDPTPAMQRASARRRELLGE